MGDQRHSELPTLGGHARLAVCSRDTAAYPREWSRKGLFQKLGSAENRPKRIVYRILYGWSKVLEELGNMKYTDTFEMSPP